MSALTLTIQALGYDDDRATSNPLDAPILWRRSMANVPVENPETRQYAVDPLGSVTVIDGSRSLSVDGTTEFSLALKAATRYRMTWTDGTAPGFRTDRNLDASSVELTLTLNSNLSVTVTGSGSVFAAVQVGDVVFVPGLSTGDSASPFSPLNEGLWTVLSNGADSITIARAQGETFQGASEVVTPSSASQFQAFSATGVQVGDTIEISGGFSAATQRSYDLVAVNPKWIEFQSTFPLGPETGVLPTAAGIAIYTTAKRFVAIQSDQELVVRFNGDTGSTNRVTPIIPGDKNFPGVEVKLGLVWKLVVVNRSSARATVKVSSAE